MTRGYAHLIAFSAGFTLWATGATGQPGALADLHTRAEQGNAEAQFMIASLYADGTVVDQNVVEAAVSLRSAKD